MGNKSRPTRTAYKLDTKETNVQLRTFNVQLQSVNTSAARLHPINVGSSTLNVGSSKQQSRKKLYPRDEKWKRSRPARTTYKLDTKETNVEHRTFNVQLQSVNTSAARLHPINVGSSTLNVGSSKQQSRKKLYPRDEKWKRSRPARAACNPTENQRTDNERTDNE